MTKKKKILLHSCCAPCSTSVFEKLENENYLIESFFFNPNIYPQEEYLRRKNELIQFCKVKNYNYTIKENFELWDNAVIGFENEKERGKRCEICFRVRLEETAKFASNNNYNAFTTVLTVSPHKDSLTINRIGKNLAEKYNIEFMKYNFKKENGFKRSLELSKAYNLYRQKYCGCKYSIRD